MMAESFGRAAFVGARNQYLVTSDHLGWFSGIRRHGVSRIYLGMATLGFSWQCVYDLALGAFQCFLWAGGGFRDERFRATLEGRFVRCLGNGVAGSISFVGMVSPRLCFVLLMELRNFLRTRETR